MNQIAEKLGISKPALYKHFESREEIIMSQRTIDVAATEIMVMETKAMIDATKKLFYALQVKHIADFPDADAAVRGLTQA